MRFKQTTLFCWMIFLFSHAVLAQTPTPTPTNSPEDKYKVCFATLNSSDEREVMRSKLPKDKFDFVELTEFANGGPMWFHEACKSGVKCDVLVISGHFGGYFFGNGKVLDLATLEQYSCAKTCEGIFSNPMDVFLFGCRTLQGKMVGASSESAQRYREALIHSGVNPREAELIAAAQYGEFGQSHRERFQTAFAKVEHLYGFDAAAPRGNYIAPLLKDYFSNNDYAAHLKETEAKKMAGLMVEANLEMKNSLRHSKYDECSGVESSRNGYSLARELKCVLLSKTASISQKLKSIQMILSQNRARNYLPYIIDFFDKNPPPYSDEADQKEYVEILKQKEQILSQMEPLLKGTSSMVHARAYSFLSKMKWLTDEQIAEETSYSSKILRKPVYTSEDREYFCAHKKEINLRISDLPPSFWKRSDSIELVSCLDHKDPDLRKLFIENAISQKNVSVREKSTSLTRSLTDLSSEELKILSQSLSSLSAEERRNWFNWIKTLKSVDDKVYLEWMRSGDFELRELAVQSFAGKPVFTAELKDTLFTYYESSAPGGKNAFLNLLKANPNSPHRNDQAYSDKFTTIEKGDSTYTKLLKLDLCESTVNKSSEAAKQWLPELQSKDPNYRERVKTYLRRYFSKQEPFQSALKEE